MRRRVQPEVHVRRFHEPEIRRVFAGDPGGERGRRHGVVHRRRGADRPHQLPRHHAARRHDGRAQRRHQAAVLGGVVVNHHTLSRRQRQGAGDDEVGDPAPVRTRLRKKRRAHQEHRRRKQTQVPHGADSPRFSAWRRQSSFPTCRRHHVMGRLLGAGLHAGRADGHPRHRDAGHLRLFAQHLLDQVRRDVAFDHVVPHHRRVTGADPHRDTAGLLDLGQVVHVLHLHLEPAAFMLDPFRAAAAGRCLVDGHGEALRGWTSRGREGAREGSPARTRILVRIVDPWLAISC